MKITIKLETDMQDLKALEGKSLAELREIAKALGIGNVMVKKRELMELIAGSPAAGPEPAAVETEPQPKAPRGRRPHAPT